MAEHGPKPKTWNEIDASLPNVAIKIMAPPPTSGTRDAWESLVMKKGCKEAGKDKELGKCALSFVRMESWKKRVRMTRSS